MVLLRSRPISEQLGQWESIASLAIDRDVREQLRLLCRDGTGAHKKKFEMADVDAALGYTAQFLWDQRVLEPLRSTQTHKAHILVLASTLSALKHPDKSRDAAQGHTDYNDRSRARVARWFWASTFDSERVSTRSVDSDGKALLDWAKDVTDELDAPPVVRRASAHLPQEEEIASWRFGSTQHKAVAALLARLDPRDLLTGERVAAEQAFAGRLNSHHLFPRAWAEGRQDHHDVDLAVNTVSISGYTNRWIGKLAPSDYLRRLDQLIGAQQVAEVLAEHLLPERELRNDDWHGFRKQRASSVRVLIEEAIVSSPRSSGLAVAKS